MHTMALESSPPERQDPTGTSLRKRTRTASPRSLPNSSNASRSSDTSRVPGSICQYRQVRICIVRTSSVIASAGSNCCTPEKTVWRSASSPVLALWAARTKRHSSTSSGTSGCNSNALYSEANTNRPFARLNRKGFSPYRSRAQNSWPRTLSYNAKANIPLKRDTQSVPHRL